MQWFDFKVNIGADKWVNILNCVKIAMTKMKWSLYPYYLPVSINLRLTTKRFFGKSKSNKYQSHSMALFGIIALLSVSYNSVKRSYRVCQGS